MSKRNVKNSLKFTLNLFLYIYWKKFSIEFIKEKIHFSVQKLVFTCFGIRRIRKLFLGLSVLSAFYVFFYWTDFHSVKNHGRFDLLAPYFKYIRYPKGSLGVGMRLLTFREILTGFLDSITIGRISKGQR